MFYAATYVIKQQSQTHSPRAAYGPRRIWPAPHMARAAYGPRCIWPAPHMARAIIKTTQIIDKTMMFCTIKALLASNCAPQRHFSS